MAKIPKRAVAREPDPEDKVPTTPAALEAGGAEQSTPGPQGAVAHELVPEGKVSETVPSALRLAHALRWAVDTAEAMLDGTYGRPPLCALADNGVTTVLDLHVDDSLLDLHSLPIDLERETLAALVEWRGYLAVGVDAAWSRVLHHGDRHEAEEAMALALGRAVEHCGGHLRRQAAKLEVSAQAAPKDTATKPQPTGPEDPHPQPILAFVPGSFFYKGHEFPLRGKPWEFLREFSRARHHTLTADQLSSLWGKLEADGVENATVKQHVSAARKALRGAIQAVDSRRGEFDPIHNVGRGQKELAWRMELIAT